jgi:hypothetical protein
LTLSLFFIYIKNIKQKQGLKMTLGEALKVYRIKNTTSSKTQWLSCLEFLRILLHKIENDKVFPSKEPLLKIIKMTGIEFKLNARIKSPSSYLINQAS